jgi:hypothetical protein
VRCVPVAKDWDGESDFTPVYHCCFSDLFEAVRVGCCSMQLIYVLW